jgi:hypothetical protein
MKLIIALFYFALIGFGFYAMADTNIENWVDKFTVRIVVYLSALHGVLMGGLIGFVIGGGNL